MKTETDKKIEELQNEISQLKKQKELEFLENSVLLHDFLQDISEWGAKEFYLTDNSYLIREEDHQFTEHPLSLKVQYSLDLITDEFSPFRSYKPLPMDGWCEYRQILQIEYIRCKGLHLTSIGYEGEVYVFDGSRWHKDSIEDIRESVEKGLYNLSKQ